MMVYGRSTIHHIPVARSIALFRRWRGDPAESSREILSRVSCTIIWCTIRLLPYLLTSHQIQEGKANFGSSQFWNSNAELRSNSFPSQNLSSSFVTSYHNIVTVKIPKGKYYFHLFRSLLEQREEERRSSAWICPTVWYAEDINYTSHHIISLIK